MLRANKHFYISLEILTFQRFDLQTESSIDTFLHTEHRQCFNRSVAAILNHIKRKTKLVKKKKTMGRIEQFSYFPRSFLKGVILYSLKTDSIIPASEL